MEKYNEYALSQLKKLIAFKTVNPSGNEREAAEYIGELLLDMGFEVKYAHLNESRSSLVASYGNGEGKTLCFNGHLDVVPANNQGWTSDPFEAVVKDGKIFGRGSCDMKGGIAAMLAASKKLVDEHKEIKGRLVLTFVADEELDNLGMHSILDFPEVKTADYVVIGEPTSLNINIAHRGTARYIIKVKGKSCHSSKPQEGINAVYKMCAVINEIERHNEALALIKHEILPPPSIAVVMIDGGEKDNIIPGECSIRVDRRLIPGDTKESVKKELTELLERIKSKDSQLDYEITPYIYLASGEVKKDSDVVRTVEAAYVDCFEKNPVVCEFQATCEQTLLTTKGIPTLIFGPGSIDQAHTINEFVNESELYDCVRLYNKLMCNVLL